MTKCINRVTLLTDDMSNYDEVCLLCNKIEFAVFLKKNLTEKYWDLVSEEEIDKDKQLCNKQELHAEEALTFCKSFLENMDKASQVIFEANAIEKFFESDQFWHNEHTKLLKSKGSGSSKSSSKRTSSSSASSKASGKSKESLLKLRQNTKLFVE